MLKTPLLRLLLAVVMCLSCLASKAAGSEGQVSTGSFQLSYTMVDLLGVERAQQVDPIVPADEVIEWDVFVPESYDPARPPGLLVYISPTRSGAMPQSWQRVLEAENLIWLAANRSGNSTYVQRRAILAVIGPTLIERSYVLDRQRVYVSGLSGGGKMASMVAADHAHIFKGAIFNCGVEFWDEQPRRIDEIRQNRYVFVTGTQDQALRPTQRVHKRYRKAGVENTLLMVLEMGHQNPPWRDFAEAVAFLDGRVESP